MIYGGFQHKSLRFNDLYRKTLLFKKSPFEGKMRPIRPQTHAIKKSFQQGQNRPQRAKKRQTCVKKVASALAKLAFSAK
ncbi:MAG: hypothetical protein IJV69_04390 [Kiritimatiellae bacterium]|nr:hypothetical protein [Kiritimatiellia bacterium]